MIPSPENITSLAPNEIFVFGSNLAGRHGAGAALFAKKNFGAVNGICMGFQGRCYSVPTKDQRLVTLPLGAIGVYVGEFLKAAKFHAGLTFLVTEIGCGLAGFHPKEIAPLFFKYQIPKNVRLPQSFIDLKPNET